MKNTEFKKQMDTLTKHHRKACKAYDDICNGLSVIATRWEADERSTEGPYLPVSIFKSLNLKSVKDDQVKRQLTSSGTTGQKVSRIYLDAETAAAQQRALCEIVGDYIGEKRIPMLIIDSSDVLRDRKKYSARGAGIMGFSMMASKRFYALDNEMKPDMKSINDFVETAADGPCFAFGFTYMIWQYFCNSGKGHAENHLPPLSNCYLIHGGGWKKLQSQAVSNEEFKKSLEKLWGIKKVSDYYGMAEQTGSIFMECECGHLHVSDYSDLTVLNPADFTPCKTGEWGLLALESTLPKSYPGHKLMTEDWGRILGEDDCPCGRRGKYFEIKGRIKKAEIRGCSDTFAEDRENPSENINEADELTEFNPYTGITASAKINSFDERVMHFLEELSGLFMKKLKYRSVPEIYALGFWCRRAHLEKIKSRQLAAWKDMGESCGHGGIGHVLHIAPSNMPTMFAYSWICALLAGCTSTVRISSKKNAVTELILEGIREIMSRDEYAEIRSRNRFIKFGHNDCILSRISENAAGRMIWGGDETVAHICNVPARQECKDITFPDKFSMALLDGDLINSLTEDELKIQAHLFYNDTYGADQNACSSPKAVFWIGSSSGRKRWWTALAKEAEKYNMEPWMATEKYRILCCEYAKAADIPAEPAPAVSWGNRLYVIPWSINDKWNDSEDRRLSQLDAKMGMFHEFILNDINEIILFLDSRIQTIVTNLSAENLPEELKESVDRIVAVGEALDFNTTWDRKDIISMLSQPIKE